MDGAPAPGENMRIDADRLWDSLMEMARIGPGIAGGNNRQTLTDADAEGPGDLPALGGGGRLHRSAWMPWAPCSPPAPGRIRTPCRSMSARTSTPSPRGASTTGCWASSAVWRSSAR